MIRIKCAVCPDFDLCIECFSVGAEVHPHKSDHPYRVMDNLSFPLICPDWNADEESLLLEGIEMYGLSNWVEVAEHVGTKSKSECIDHYNSVYLNSPCFPLPDLSHVFGKNREELQAMAKEHNELKKALEEVALKEEFLSFAKAKVEEQRKEALGSQSSQPEAASTMGSIYITSATKKPPIVLVVKDGSDDIKVEDTHSDRKVGEKKPRMDEGPSVTDVSGYNPKRQEFEIEYDNDAEQLLADMEFKETDTEAERELKLRVLKIYNRRLDERKRLKDFILERNLLYLDPFEKNLSPEEKQICQQYRVFMRFHSKEDHEELLRTVIEEHRILKRIQDLQEAKAAGCRTSSEAERYIGQKWKREAEENARKMKEAVEVGSGGKGLLRSNHPREFGTNDSSSGQLRATSLDDWDITGFPGADLLSDTEKRLCREIRILPSHYLDMLQTMSMEVMKGNINKKSDAHSLFGVVPSKVDRVYDMLVKRGLAPL
ncbi:transcriptional adapter ADA2-like isoform X2 [Silene latifolia]